MRTSRAAIDERLSRLEEAVVPHAAEGPVFVFVHAGENAERAIKKAGGDENTVVVRIVKTTKTPAVKCTPGPDDELAGLKAEVRELEEQRRKLKARKKR